MATDYGKFEKLIEAEEEAEKKEKEDESMKRRMKYEREQKTKQEKWDAKLIKEGKDPVEERRKYGGCAFSHMQSGMAAMGKHGHSHSHDHSEHGHAHEHSHDHGHGHAHGASKGKSSCGYMPPEEIKRLSEERSKKKTMSIGEKNAKKMAAVYAAKTDGNRLFAEGKFEVAYKVYERGVLIINGMYQLSDAKEDEMERVECLLDLNMALVSLKREDYAEAINCCRMALQIDAKSAKAHFRWSAALIAMSDYDEARTQSLKAKELEPKNGAIDKQLSRIDELQRVQMEKAKKEDQRISKRMQTKKNKKRSVVRKGCGEKAEAEGC